MKFITITLLIAALSISSTYNFNTTAAVVIAGGIIKSKYAISIDKKYPRKDCPVCKGKGWYMSGDGIKKIECSYCEPDTKINCSSNQCKTAIIKK
jgi:hypothetical protein